MTKVRIDLAGDSLTHDAPPVRLAATRALAAAGKQADGYTKILAVLLTDRSNDVADGAAEALIKIGPATSEAMVACLAGGISNERRQLVIRAFGKYGTQAPAAALKQVLSAAEKEVDLRPAVATALVKINNDAVSSCLLEVVKFDLVGMLKKRTTPYPLDYQLWALDTIGNLNPKELSAPEVSRLLAQLDMQAKSDPFARMQEATDAARQRIRSKQVAK